MLGKRREVLYKGAVLIVYRLKVLINHHMVVHGNTLWHLNTWGGVMG